MEIGGGGIGARSPAIAADGSGALLVAWVETAGASKSAQELRAQVLGPAGVPQGPPVVLEGAIGLGSEVHASVAGLPRGWAVVWRSPVVDGDLGGIGYAIVQPDGSRPFAGRANEDGHGDQREPRAAGTGDGFVVVWTDTSGVSSLDPGLGLRARRFGATGAPRGGELVVSTTRAGDQLEPDVAARADRWAVVWTDTSSGSPVIRARRFDGGAALDAADLRIGEAPASDAAVALGEGGLGAVWVSRADDPADTVEGCWLSNGATEIVSPVWHLGAVGERDERPEVALRADEEVIVAYWTADTPRGLRVAAQGIALSPEVASLGAHLAGAGQEDVALAANARGLWVSWSVIAPGGGRAVHAFGLPWD